MKKILILTSLIILIGFGSFVFSGVARAVDDDPSVVSLQNPLSSLSSSGERIKAEGAAKKKGVTDISLVAGRIIKESLKYIGGITLLIFLYGGFMWLISGGDAEKVKKGSQTVLWAVVGLFIIFSSYAILDLVLKALGV